MLSRLLRPLSAALLLCCIGAIFPAVAATKHTTHHSKKSSHKATGPALVVRGDVVTSRGMVDAIAKAYEASGGSRVDVQPFNTLSGIDAALNGSADIAASARPGFTGRVQEAGLNFTPVAWDALVMITSPDNPVGSITLKQLRDVYYGEITNWKDLGGKDEPIDLYTVASPLDGAEFSLRRLLFGSGDARVMMPRMYINVSTLEQGVALDPKSLGLSTLSGVHDNKQVKIIPIEGVTPTPATVADGSYQLYFSIYLASNPGSPHVAEIAKFMDFLRTDKARQLARSHDLLPYSDAPVLVAQTIDQQIASINAKMVSEGLPVSKELASASSAQTNPPQLAAQNAQNAAKLAQQANAQTQNAATPEQARQAASVATQAAGEANTAAQQAHAVADDSRKSDRAVNKAEKSADVANANAAQAQAVAGTDTTARGSSVSGVAPVAHDDKSVSATAGNPALNKAEATAPSNPVMISASGAVTPVPPATATASGGSYTVSKGDTLSAIARKHSVSVSDLRKWNDLKNDNLRVGQTLKLSATP